MSDLKQAYDYDVETAWCPGCGNFGILKSLKQALVELELPPQKVLICTGIGQAPKLPHYMHVNTFNGLHGREIPAAIAAKLAAPDLTVLVHSGDGGAYAEGGNHFVHAIRRNINITLVVHDNHYYALTKAQASPTTPLGTITKVNPEGVIARPVNPLALAISQSCSFVAQSMSARSPHLPEILKQAIQHQGFSFVSVFQPCVSWDKTHTYNYYRDHCYELAGDYDPTNRAAALDLVLNVTDKHPLGIIYRENRPTYDEQILAHIDSPLHDRPVTPQAVTELFPLFQ